MFEVESEWQFIRHYVGNRAVAEAVAANLADRGKHPEAVTVVPCDMGVWDPGGSLWTGDTRHTFDLGETQIEVYYQHLSAFVSWVIRKKTKEIRIQDGVSYHKIHSGYMGCICVTPAEYQTLLEQVNDVELAFKGSIAREESRSRSAQAGVLQVARVKDKDGQDQVAVVAPIDPTLN